MSRRAAAQRAPVSRGSASQPALRLLRRTGRPEPTSRSAARGAVARNSTRRSARAAIPPTAAVPRLVRPRTCARSRHPLAAAPPPQSQQAMHATRLAAKRLLEPKQRSSARWGAAPRSRTSVVGQPVVAAAARAATQTAAPAATRVAVAAAQTAARPAAVSHSPLPEAPRRQSRRSVCHLAQPRDRRSPPASSPAAASSPWRACGRSAHSVAEESARWGPEAAPAPAARAARRNVESAAAGATAARRQARPGRRCRPQ